MGNSWSVRDHDSPVLGGSSIMEWNILATFSSLSSYAVGFMMELGGEGSGVALNYRKLAVTAVAKSREGLAILSH